MNNFDDAVSSLKKKLQALGAASAAMQDEMVALTNFTAGNVTKYLGSSINVDWDPKDHPRDPNTGEFIKTPGGFIFGKTAKANFKNLPTVTLNPGDVAFKTPGLNVLISHADGSYTLQKKSGVKEEVPGGAQNTYVTALAAQGKLEKIGENPGVKVPAFSVENAKVKLKSPALWDSAKSDTPKATISDPKASDQTNQFLSGLTDPPSLKAGKTEYTDKQYAEYQAENLDKIIATDSHGNPVRSGGWIDYEGKPYQVHASPYGKGKITAYRWVSTKQKASNLPKEDFLPEDVWKSANAIEDPTGKPYTGFGASASSEPVKDVPAHGSLMSSAAQVAIPNASVAHKKYVQDNLGKKVSYGLYSGDWVEIDGKPVQVFASPNEGMVAVAKWIAKKQKASGNTYDYPSSVLNTVKGKIPDPSGKDYTPLPTADYATPEPVVAPAEPDDLWTPKPTFEPEEPKPTWGTTKANGGQSPTSSDAWILVDEDGVVYNKYAKNADGDWTWVNKSDSGIVTETEFFQSEFSFEYSPNLKWSPVDVSFTFPPPPQVVPDATAPLADWEKELLGMMGTKSPIPEGTEVHWNGTDYVTDPFSGKWVYKEGPFKFANASDQADITLAYNESMEVVAAIDAMKPGDTLFEKSKMGYADDPSSNPGGDIVYSYVLASDGNTFLTEDGSGVLKAGMKKAIADSVHLAKWNVWVESKQNLAEKPDSPKGNIFVHPISGVEWQLSMGDVVYKHKSTPNTFIIVSKDGDPDKPINFINQYGKVYKPKAFQKNLATSYVETTDWPGHKDDSPAPYPTSVTAEKIFAATSGDKIVTKSGVTYTKADFWWNAPTEEVSGTGMPFQLSNGQMNAHVADLDNFSGGTFVAYDSITPVFDSEKQKLVDSVTTAKEGDSLTFVKNTGDSTLEYTLKSDGMWYMKGGNAPAWESNAEVISDVVNHYTTGEYAVTFEGNKASQADLDAAPEGTKIALKSNINGTVVEYVKNKNGKWFDPQSFEVESNTLEAVLHAAGSSWSQSKWELPKKAKTPKITKKKMDDAPAGTVFGIKSGDQSLEYTKIADTNNWQATSGAILGGGVLSKALDNSWELQKWEVPEGTPSTPEPPEAKEGWDDKSLTYTFSDGSELKAGPGESIWKISLSSGIEYVLHANSLIKSTPLGNNKIYGLDGKIASEVTAYKTWTAADMKDSPVFNLLHLKKLPTKPAKEVTLPDAEPLTVTSTYDENYDAVTQVAKQFSSIVPMSYGTVAYYQDVPGYNTSFQGLTVEQQTELIGKYDIPAAIGHATFESILASNKDKSTNTEATKNKNRMLIVYRAARVAKEMLNPDTEWTDDDFTAELAFLSSKTVKPGVSMGGAFKARYPVTEFTQTLLTANQKRLFKNALDNNTQGINPYTATSVEMDAWAKTKGENHLSVLTPEQQQQWVLAEMGDPSIGPNAKTKLKIDILSGKNLAIVAAQAQAFKGKTKPKPKKVQGVTDKMSLRTTYAWKKVSSDGTKVPMSLVNIGNDEWHLLEAGKPPAEYNDAVVVALVNSLSMVDADTTEDFIASEGFAYDGSSVSAKFESLKQKYVTEMGFTAPWTSMFPSAQAKVITSEGATDNGMGPQDRSMWLAAHLRGDQIAKFHIENQYFSTDKHPLWQTHPGSPDSPTGKLAYQALAQRIQSFSWGEKYLGGTITVSDIDQINADLGFQAWSSILDPGTTTGKIATFTEWRDTHPAAQVTKFLSTSGGMGAKAKAEQPYNVSDDVWAFVNGVGENTDISELIGAYANLTDAEADNAALQGAVTKTKTLLPSVPTYTKRLLAWAKATDETTADQIYTALLAKIYAGEYLTEDTPVWIAPNGEKYPISPGAQVWYSESYNRYFISGPPKPDGSLPDSGFIYNVSNESLSNANETTSQSILSGNNSQYKTKLFTMPSEVKWDQAKKENPEFVFDVWNLVSGLETGASAGADIYYAPYGIELTAYLKESSHLKETYPHLYAQHAVLPEHIRKGMWAALENKSQPLQQQVMAILDYKAAKGHYNSMQTKGLFTPGAPWIVNISQGQFSESAIQSDWTFAAKDAYIKEFGLPDAGAIFQHLDGLLNPALVTVQKPLPAFSELKLTKTGENPGGAHSKQIWLDQDANKWMTKAFGSDPNSKLRIDREHVANLISTLLGFRAPLTNAMKIKEDGGTYSYIQHFAPSTGDFVGVSPDSLSTKQLGQAMEEHVLDWIISNHDSHHKNLMFDPQGNIFGIDKGQAFKHFPNDKLAVGYRPSENPDAVWYDLFYNAVRKGTISKEKADEVVKHVLRRAQKISKAYDEDFKALLEEANKNAHEGIWPEAYPSKDQFISALIERKHNVFEDFTKFYKDLYESSPYEWDIDTENLVPPMLDEHTHIQVSTDLASDIFQSGIHGKALFFSSSEVADSHIMFSKVIGSDGNPMLTGEAKIKIDGDTTLTNWLKQQTVINNAGNSSYYQQQSYAAAPPDISTLHEQMPQNYEWYNALVAGSKTVSSHNKSGDTSYNTGTLQQMENVHGQMVSIKTSLEKWVKDNPKTPAAKFKINGIEVDLKTAEQQESYLKMLDTYLGYYQNVIDKKGTSEKVTPHFTQHVYSPSPAANAEYSAMLNPKNAEDAVKFVGKAKPGQSIIKEVNGQTFTFTKDENGDWKDVNDVWYKPTVLKATLNIDADKATFGINETETEADVTAQVKVGTKVLKVVYRSAASQSGTLKDGELTMNSGETSVFDTGHMYEIDFGSTVIEYRPHTEGGVGKAQRGLLKFRKTDWKEGDAESIDEILDVLRHMGLDLTPADEESMELYFWKHMVEELKDRSDRKSPKWKKTLEAIDAAYLANKNMTPNEELQAMKEAWALSMGQDVVDKADWHPKFSRNRPHSLKDSNDLFTTGKPYWIRPDFSYETLRQTMNGRVTASSLYNNGSSYNTGDALKIAKSGASMSSEERYRVLSAGWASGWSSGQDVNKGSSFGVFTRQNMGLGWTGGYAEQIYYHPRVIARTQNYAFGGDEYGNVEQKSSQAHFSLDKASSIGSGGNELLITNALAVMDDVLFLRFGSESDRTEAINYYNKNLGITHIGGRPVEEVFVMASISNAEMKKRMNAVWDQLIADEKAGK